MTSPTFSLIGVGSPIIDSLAHVDDAFLSQVGGAKGGMELIENEAMNRVISLISGGVVEVPGGSAGNTTLSLARLGVPVTFLGKLGQDTGGAFYRENFASAGGDISRFKTCPKTPNARCLSLVTPDSERTMRTYLGASMMLLPEEISAVDFTGCRHAHIEGYILFNRDLALTVLRSAKEAGCTVSLDLASFEVVNAGREVLGDWLKEYVDVVFANEDEARAFFGGDDYESMARRFAESCEVGIVKLGAEGSLIASKGELHRINPVRIPRAIDTTGAGDAWAAGFLHGWLAGKDLPTCGRYGSILGAEVVQVMGPAVPVERWAKLNKDLS